MGHALREDDSMEGSMKESTCPHVPKAPPAQALARQHSPAGNARQLVPGGQQRPKLSASTLSFYRYTYLSLPLNKHE